MKTEFLSSNKTYPVLSSPTLLSYITGSEKKILDVGSGTGGHGRLIKKKYPYSQIDCITISEEEIEVCSTIYDNTHLIDIEKGSLSDLSNNYDLIIFSHVLEHMAYPDKILEKFTKLLSKKGRILVVVPNFLHYINRVKLLLGILTYTKEGIMDYTHMRFFSKKNTPDLLIGNSNLLITHYYYRGLHPNSKIHKLLGNNIAMGIDNLSLKISPGLFAEEFILDIRKNEL